MSGKRVIWDKCIFYILDCVFTFWFVSCNVDLSFYIFFSQFWFVFSHFGLCLELLFVFDTCGPEHKVKLIYVKYMWNQNFYSLKFLKKQYTVIDLSLATYTGLACYWQLVIQLTFLRFKPLPPVLLWNMVTEFPTFG